MAVFRVEKTKDFTIMSNHHLRNTELSLKAKGLLSLMLSLPEDWDYTTKGLAHICKDGVDSITTALKELERHGYLTRQRLRYDNGQLGDIEYTIHEQPVSTENTGLSDFNEKNAFNIEKFLSTRMPMRPGERYRNYEVTAEDLASQTL